MSARIQLIGPLSVLGDLGVVSGPALGGRRAQLVLIALASTPGGMGSVALAERIWAEPPVTWATALRGTVLGLRSALNRIGLGGQILVQTTSTGWALASDVEIDVLRATDIIEVAENHLGNGSAESALEVISSLGELGTTTLLPLEDADWIVELRRRISELDERALAVEAEAALRLGRGPAATAAARRLLTLNALDERTHRVLIRALAASGDRAGAINAFEECRAVLAEQLGMDPGTETTAAYLEVLRSGSSGGAGNLPTPPGNGFFGRRDELSRLVLNLRDPGVVSVLGRGGVGKTRLALHASQSAIPDSPGNKFWVHLGDLRSSGLVAVTIAHSIGAEEGPDPVGRIVERLAPLGETLLVLDGCEEMIDGVSEVLSLLLPSTPRLRVLATSRRPLETQAERKVEVLPLRVPVTVDAELGRNAAVQLLSDRMASRGKTLLLDARNASAVQQLCIRCGGIPLALELAAAQLGSMAVADLLDLLPTAAMGAEGVVTSLLEQSYDSLTPDEATLFRTMGAIEGALPLALVGALGADRTAPGRVARMLAELTDRGLLEIDRSGPRWHYRQDDQVRQFARTRLSAEEGAVVVWERLAMAVRGLLPDDARTPPGPFREAIGEASDAFRTLFEASSHDMLPREVGLEFAFRLHRYWAVAGMAEGRYWLGRLLPGAPSSTWMPFASFASGYLAYWAGDTGTARTQLEDAAQLLRGIDDSFAARSLLFASGIADDQDHPIEAIKNVRAAIELAESTEDANVLVSATMAIASILAERADPEAVWHAHRALTLARQLGSADQLVANLATAAMVAWQVGAMGAARDAISEAASLFEGDARISRMVLATAAAGVDLADGRLESAARMAELSVSDGEELGVDRELPLAHAMRARVALARGRRREAARSTLDAFASAARLDYRYPMAICLETAALVLGVDLRTAGLVATAAELRRAGDRPAPYGLQVAVPRGAQAEPLATAVERGRTLLAMLVAERH